MKPYEKAQNVPYVGLQDRRRKLTDDQRAEILKLRAESDLGYRAIARLYGVSRSLIRLICDKEAAKRNSDRMKANWRRYYKAYGKDHHAEVMRTFRNRKYKMFMRGELVEKPSPPVVRQKMETKVIYAITPNGRRKAVRVPLSFLNETDGAEHVGRKWRTVRRERNFFVFPVHQKTDICKSKTTEE